MLSFVRIPAVLYSMLVGGTVERGAYPGYCAIMFNPLITAPVLFNTYNTAGLLKAYPFSSVDAVTFAGTLARSTLSYPIKVALFPITLTFLST